MKDLCRVATAALVLTGSFVAQGVGAAVDSSYAQPDPYGTTAAARVGYIAVRDQASSLVRGDYLNVVHEARPAILDLALKEGTPGAANWRACPQGGKVKGSYTQEEEIAYNRHWTFQFAGCKIADRTLSGGLELDAREFSPTASHVATVFKNLSFRGPAGSLQLVGLEGFDVRGSLYQPIPSDCGSFPGAYFAQDSSAVSSVTIRQNGVTTTLRNTRYTEISRAAQRYSSGDGGPVCRVGAAFKFDGAIESAQVGGRNAPVSSVAIEYNSRRNKYVDDFSDRTGGYLSVTFNDGSGFFTDTPNARDGVSTVYARENGSAVSFVDDEYRYRPRIR